MTIDLERTVLRLSRQLATAADPSQMWLAAQAAMRFLMAPVAHSLTVASASRLHVFLAQVLLVLDEGGGWSVEARTLATQPLLEELRSDDPRDLCEGVRAAMLYVQTPAARALPRAALEELFRALGGAQAALRELARRSDLHAVTVGL